MDTSDSDSTGKTVRGDALVEALVAPGQSSFIDALLALADEAGSDGGDEIGRRVLNSGLQAALARKMRAIIDHDGTRNAA